MSRFQQRQYQYHRRNYEIFDNSGNCDLVRDWRERKPLVETSAPADAIVAATTSITTNDAELQFAALVAYAAKKDDSEGEDEAASAAAGSEQTVPQEDTEGRDGLLQVQEFACHADADGATLNVTSVATPMSQVPNSNVVSTSSSQTLSLACSSNTSVIVGSNQSVRTVATSSSSLGSKSWAAAAATPPQHQTKSKVPLKTLPCQPTYSKKRHYQHHHNHHYYHQAAPTATTTSTRRGVVLRTGNLLRDMTAGTFQPKKRIMHSFGTILEARTDSDQWILGVRRVYTIGFESLVNGSFSLDMLPLLAQDMTVSERQDIHRFLTVLHHAVASCNDRVSDDDCADPSTVTQARQGDASAAPAFALGGVDEREERTKIAEDCPIVMVGFDSLWERIFHDQSREDKNRKFALRQLVGLAAFQWPFWQQTIVRAAQTTYWLRPALEFPKGHKASLSETDAECAAREVCEETQLRLHEDYELNQAIYPIHETFVGMNRKTYKYTYNVGTVLLESRFHPSHLLKQVADAAGLDGVPKSPQAQLEADADSGEQPRVLELDLLADKTKSGKGVGESAFEIGSVAWYSAHALVDEIRPTHVTRRDVARKVQKLLLKHHV